MVTTMFLFTALYSLYGVIHGLTDSVRLLVGEGDGVPRVLQTTLSLLAWSPLFSVLVTPAVEAVHMPYVNVNVNVNDNVKYNRFCYSPPLSNGVAKKVNGRAH